VWNPESVDDDVAGRSFDALEHLAEAIAA